MSLTKGGDMAGETVLIVEDRRENIVHLANNVLKPNGYQVITAMDGQKGLGRIMTDAPDLVILDLNMPKMDGLEVLAALQERQVETPVILTTFYGSEQVAQQALHLGAVDYIVKPYEIEEMLGAIEKALTHDRAAPSAEETDTTVEQVMPLTRQVERWMRDMNILTRIGKTLVAQPDPDRVCARAVEAAIYIARADHAFLFLMQGECETQMCLCGTRGPRDQRVRRVDAPVESELAMRVAQSGETLLQPQPAADPALSDIAGQPVGPTVGVPLRWQGESVGVLLAARRPDEPAFGESDAEWLGGLADYVAIAVRNAWANQAQAQAPPRENLNAETLMFLQAEMEQLAGELEAASRTVRQLMALLGAEDTD
jgi:CheY-like chemotaxis protein